MLDRVEKEMAICLGHAEQQTDRLHGKLGRHVDQKVTHDVDGRQQVPHPSAQLVFQVAHCGGCQTTRHESADAGVAGVVHHVEHDTCDRQVLEDGSPVRPVATRLGGERQGIVEDLEDVIVGGYRPESLSVRGVGGGLVPPDGCLFPMQPEDVVGEPVGERVEIGQVHVAEVRHRAILMKVSGSVKNGGPGGVAQLAEAGRLNRPQ